MGRFYVEPLTLWLRNDIMNKEEITFVLLAYCWVNRNNRKRPANHRHSMFADCCKLVGAVRRYIANGSWRRNIGTKFMEIIRVCR